MDMIKIMLSISYYLSPTHLYSCLWGGVGVKGGWSKGSSGRTRRGAGGGKGRSEGWWWQRRHCSAPHTHIQWQCWKLVQNVLFNQLINWDPLVDYESLKVQLVRLHKWIMVTFCINFGWMIMLRMRRLTLGNCWKLKFAWLNVLLIQVWHVMKYCRMWLTEKACHKDHDFWTCHFSTSVSFHIET